MRNCPALVLLLEEWESEQGFFLLDRWERNLEMLSEQEFSGGFLSWGKTLHCCVWGVFVEAENMEMKPQSIILMMTYFHKFNLLLILDIIVWKLLVKTFQFALRPSCTLVILISRKLDGIHDKKEDIESLK